jgi:hypothetical protein
LVFVSLLVGAAPILAQDPDAGRDAYLFSHEAGQPCTACHDDVYFLDPSNRTAVSYFELRGWVQGCSQEFPQGWFPEDEDNVAAYLNRQYYRFVAD